MAGCFAIFHKQLGDLVLLEPALARLRDYHGGPVDLLTRSGHAPLLSLMKDVRPLPLLVVKPRRHLYCFDPLNKSALRSALLPAFHKTCLLPEKREQKWFHPLIFRSLLVPELGEDYVAEYFWRHLPVPSERQFRPPSLAEPPASWRPPGFSTAPFILVNATAGWQKKSWTVDGWVEVIRHVACQAGCRVVITSAPEPWQVSHCREIADRAGACVEILSQGTTLENYLWLCSQALAVLGVDSSASHLAAAFRVRNLTLFGTTSIRNWHYSNESNVAVQAPASSDGIARMRNLKPEDVLAIASPFLDRPLKTAVR